MNIKLDDDLGVSLDNGILLCQLVNKLHPNTIATIHVPRQGEVKRGGGGEGGREKGKGRERKGGREVTFYFYHLVESIVWTKENNERSIFH